jgi:hypothetical protein
MFGFTSSAIKLVIIFCLIHVNILLCSISLLPCVPASKINPKPIQKPIPVYLGGFSPHTFSRIIKYDLNGWLGVVGGPLEYVEDSIKSIRGQASQANKNPDKFQIIISAAPNVKSSSRDENRFPFSGSIDEIGSDIQRVKDIGVNHIVFAYNFLPIGRNVNEPFLLVYNFLPIYSKYDIFSRPECRLIY